MIEINGLDETVRGQDRRRRTEFRVGAGVVTGFLGPNGAGKSTIMRVIAGIAMNWSSRRGASAGAGHSRPAAVADLACLETVYFGAVGGGGRGTRRLRRRAGRHHGCPAARRAAAR
jgi:ABC-type hemin transport system ATPase subunit